MKNNITIICYDNALSRRIAKSLCEEFDMRLFDMYDMFNFDNAPYSFSEILQLNGEKYVSSGMRGILKSEFTFSNTMLVVDTKVVSENQDLFGDIKDNNLVLFLKNDFKQEYAQREHNFFKSEEEKKYFSLELDKLCEIDMKIERELADIVFNVDGLNFNQIKENILETLKKL